MPFGIPIIMFLKQVRENSINDASWVIVSVHLIPSTPWKHYF